MMYIDTHCHLNFAAFSDDLNNILDQARENGVDKIIIPGAKIDSSKIAIEIAKSHASCYAAIGIHPHHIQDYINLGSQNINRELNILLSEKKVVAVGEIGLDYHQYKGYPQVSAQVKKIQQELLLLQIDLAVKFNLPIIFHCRNAYNDLLTFLAAKLSSKISGVVHCFEGDIKHLQLALDLGLYIGFDGNITYPENQRLRNLVKATPTDRLLLETDSPYLTPVPHRRTRNNPSYIIFTAKAVASIMQKETAEIAQITYNNAAKLFKLEI